MQKTTQAISLQKRVAELEAELAQAKATILSLKANESNADESTGGTIAQDFALPEADSFREALMVAPYPLLIWRQDGKVLMVNEVFSKITGYTVKEIPTVAEWARRAFGLYPHPSLVVNEGSSSDIKKWKEFKVTTLTGEQRVWDFSNAPFGRDEIGQPSILTMAVDITERSQIEEQLEENEQKFSIIFNKAPFAAALSRLPEGILINVNEEFERVFGYTRQEAIGRTPLELGINLEIQARVQMAEDVQLHGSARNVEGRLLTKSGESRVFLLNIDLVNIVGSKYALQTAQDITERKQAEQVLKEKELQEQELYRLLELDRAKLSAILDHLPVGVWISDQQGKLISKNEQADRIWAGEAPLLQSISEYQQYLAWYPDADVPLRSEEYPMAIALQTGQPVKPVELKIRRFDGSEGTVLVSAVPIKDDQGQSTGVVAVNVDITDRKIAERALQASEERFSKAFLRSPFGMNITRWEDGIILDANDAWLHLLGWTREEILGKTTADFPFYANPEERSRVRDRIKKDEVSGDMELQLIRKDGTRLVVEVATTLIELLGERCILGVLNDITERKQAEEALRESEERYRAVVENALDAIIVADPFQNGRVISANPAACQMFGYSPDEFKTLDRETLLDLEDPRLNDFLRVRSDQGHIKGELLYKRRNGKHFLGEVTSAYFKDQNGKQNAITIIRDVTERKQAEDSIRESEQRYRGLFERMQEGLIAAEVITDEDGKPIDYRYLDINPASERQFGIPRERFIGNLYTEVLPERDAEWIQVLGNVALTGDPASIERYIPSRGRWFEAHAYSPRPGQFVNILTDITERRQAEEALRESEKRFRSLADSMPQLVWTALPDGRVDYYNQRYKEYQDINPRSGDDWDWAPVLHPDDSQATVDAWLHSIETGEIYQVEHRVRMADGSYRWHLSRGVPMRDENGRILRWFGTATDIHNLKLAEEQSRVYASRLEQSNRELEQFAFMASHDLQEPLRKIEMFGDLLLERVASLTENERTYVDRMRSAAGRMRAMIEGLLQISRVATQGRPFVQVDLNKVTLDAISDFENQIHQSGAKVILETLPPVTGDPLQLRQLMQNLIGNALKYHQPGRQPEIKISADLLDDRVQIQVEDKGIGFDQEDAHRIFEPFQRLVGRSQYAGSGIGLAICRRIVERHGGEIAAVSEPGQGTTFIINLPLHPAMDAEEDSRKDSNDDDTAFTSRR